MGGNQPLSRLTFQSHACSAFNKTQLPPELRRVLSCESPAVFLHNPLKEKGPWDPFSQLRWVLAKGRHLLQILLKALCMSGEEQSDPLGRSLLQRHQESDFLVSQVHPYLCELASSLLSRWLNSLLVPVYTLSGEWCY